MKVNPEKKREPTPEELRAVGRHYLDEGMQKFSDLSDNFLKAPKGFTQILIDTRLIAISALIGGKSDLSEETRQEINFMARKAMKRLNIIVDTLKKLEKKPKK